MQYSTSEFSAEFLSEAGLPLKAEYRVTSGISASDGASGADVYGISAVLSNGSQEIDSDEIADISASREKVVALASKLAQNCVTPVTLRDVIEDYLAYAAMEA